MQIDIKKEDRTVTIKPLGNIDYVTAPALDETIEKEAPEAESMVLDMSEVKYISSAGLRSVLNADELMEGKGGLRLVNVNNEVRSIFDMTNFTEMLDIE